MRVLVTGGHLLSEDGVRGTITFSEHLRSRIRPDGGIDAPYPLTLRR